MAAEQRMEMTKTFIEGHGHLVREIPVGSKAEPVVSAHAARVLTVEDVSPELARQVCELAGLAVVPVSFLNPEQWRSWESPRLPRSARRCSPSSLQTLPSP